jgi:hypothetical protein
MQKFRYKKSKTCLIFQLLLFISLVNFLKVKSIVDKVGNYISSLISIYKTFDNSIKLLFINEDENSNQLKLRLLVSILPHILTGMTSPINKIHNESYAVLESIIGTVFASNLNYSGENDLSSIVR